MLDLKIHSLDPRGKTQRIMEDYFYPFIVGLLLIFLMKNFQNNEYSWKELSIYPGYPGAHMHQI